MKWNDHSALRGLHAFLSPSKYHWVNYSPDKLKTAYINHLKSSVGTQLHSLAENCIRLKVRLPNTSTSLNMFVNDAIGFRMSPETIVYYSPNAFGSVDAICFVDDILRIHDLKTGVSPGHFAQLEIYAAIFYLEYNVNPNQMETLLRIYQGDEVREWSPESENILRIMGTITEYDRLIDEVRVDYG